MDKKLSLLWLFIFYFSGCASLEKDPLLPHYQQHNIALNNAYASKLTGQELRSLIEKTITQIHLEKQNHEQITQMIWAIAGYAHSGVRDVQMNTGTREPTTQGFFDPSLSFICFEYQHQSIKDLWIKRQGNSYWQSDQWLITRLSNACHEVPHSQDGRLGKTLKERAAYSAWFSNLSPEEKQKFKMLLEMWADFGGAILYHTILTTVTPIWERKGPLVPAALSAPNLSWVENCTIKKENGKTRFVYQPIENIMQDHYVLNTCKSLEAIYQELKKQFEAVYVPYELGAVAIMILESETTMQDLELAEFIRTCPNWKTMAKRVDAILAQRNLKECVKRFTQNRYKLIEALEARVH